MIQAFFAKYALLLGAAVIAALFAVIGVQTVRLSGAKTELANYRTQVAQERQQQTQAALDEAADKARETKRRLERQQENQREQDAMVARMRRDLDDALAVADRVRQQSAQAAREWSARLGDSPTREDLAAAAAAIELLADVRSRLERSGAELAGYAGAARAAGLKCEADYDALTERKQ